MAEVAPLCPYPWALTPPHPPERSTAFNGLVPRLSSLYARYYGSTNGKSTTPADSARGVTRIIQRRWPKGQLPGPFAFARVPLPPGRRKRPPCEGARGAAPGAPSMIFRISRIKPKCPGKLGFLGLASARFPAETLGSDPMPAPASWPNAAIPTDGVCGCQLQRNDPQRTRNWGHGRATGRPLPPTAASGFSPGPS